MIEPLETIGLFDGLSCLQESLKQCNIPVKNYYASEIEPQPIKVTQRRYPETIHIGNVLSVRIPKGKIIHLLGGGSPCQGFSYSGLGLNFNDPRSRLFFEYERVLKECKRYNPDVKFLLENVNMKQEWQNVITDRLGVEPIRINSGLVSAQNRDRLYWTNIQGVNQPTHTGIYLRDILEPFVDEKYYLSERAKQGFINRRSNNAARGAGFCHNLRTGDDKAHTILARYHKDGKECLIDCGDRWRKLTPVEVERLQGLPDNYTDCISDTQRYKALGNGWNIQTINHILANLL